MTYFLLAASARPAHPAHSAHSPYYHSIISLFIYLFIYNFINQNIHPFSRGGGGARSNEIVEGGGGVYANDAGQFPVIENVPRGWLHGDLHAICIGGEITVRQRHVTRRPPISFNRSASVSIVA